MSDRIMAQDRVYHRNAPAQHGTVRVLAGASAWVLWDNATRPVVILLRDLRLAPVADMPLKPMSMSKTVF